MSKDNDFEILVFNISDDHLIWTPNLDNDSFYDLPVKPIKMKMSEYHEYREKCQRGLNG